MGGRTDGRMDGRLRCSYTSACIACYAIELVKTDVLNITEITPNNR